MDTLSPSEAARRLGTNLPRLQRAMRRIGIPTERGQSRISPEALKLLRAEIGVGVPVEGFTRVETQVLAALARAPRGLVSARAVARRAGVSPTSAGKAVRSLSERGLVRRRQEWVAAGQARQTDVLYADVTYPGWPSLAPALASMRLPVPKRPKTAPGRVPSHLRRLFWNADQRRLDVRRHGAYIAERLLSTHDLDGLAWGLWALRPSDWIEASKNRGLSAAEKALACNLARHGAR